MTSYVKNDFRKKVIDKYGQVAGLPLFESVMKRLSRRTQSRFDAAPKSFHSAKDSRNLSRIKQKVNQAELNENQQIVYDAFKAIGPATNKEISRFLKSLYPETADKWEASTVNARNFELRQFGKIKDAGKRVCSVTQEVVHQWKAI